MMFQILLLASAVVAIVIGIDAFRGGIRISGRSKKRMTGTAARVIGVICLVYGFGICVVILGLITAVGLGWVD